MSTLKAKHGKRFVVCDTAGCRNALGLPRAEAIDFHLELWKWHLYPSGGHSCPDCWAKMQGKRRIVCFACKAETFVPSSLDDFDLSLSNFKWENLIEGWRCLACSDIERLKAEKPKHNCGTCGKADGCSVLSCSQWVEKVKRTCGECCFKSGPADKEGVCAVSEPRTRRQPESEACLAFSAKSAQTRITWAFPSSDPPRTCGECARWIGKASGWCADHPMFICLSSRPACSELNPKRTCGECAYICKRWRDQQRTIPSSACVLFSPTTRGVSGWPAAKKCSTCGRGDEWPGCYGKGCPWIPKEPKPADPPKTEPGPKYKVGETVWHIWQGGVVSFVVRFVSNEGQGRRVYFESNPKGCYEAYAECKLYASRAEAESSAPKPREEGYALLCWTPKESTR